MKFLLPLILLIIGTGGGVAAAKFLISPTEPESAEIAGDCPPQEGDLAASYDVAQADPADDSHGAAGAVDDNGDPIGGPEYARLNNQFVVPVISGDRVAAMVILSISIEVAPGAQAEVLVHEPKLRDAFLEVLFDHANIGGFDGNFTSTRSMAPLRAALRAAAREAVGPDAYDILILDLVRQDVPG